MSGVGTWCVIELVPLNVYVACIFVKKSFDCYINVAKFIYIIYMVKVFIEGSTFTTYNGIPLPFYDF